ncbi:MAG TPA: GAF domain-containing sensor histidine kinase [Terriglobales bacterium]|nr:GAF domain-containing sensor histidine kinase [Terriglobales bacterium]
MSALPIKESSRGLIAEAARILKPHFPEITAAWRSRMFEEFQFDGRVMAALERLNLGTGLVIFCQSDFNIFAENVNYFGTRLAKLQVDSRAVARSLELYQLFCEPYVSKLFDGRRAEIVGALEMLSSAVFVVISMAYFEAQKNSSAALLSVLDAELSAGNVSVLLTKVLEITTGTFGAQMGVILLREPESDIFKVTASVGFNGAFQEDFGIRSGEGFSGRVIQTGEADMISDVAACDYELNSTLQNNAKSLWAVPLRNNEQVIGILELGFAKAYAWLPTERDLLRSIADRSALAIERARMTDALREREARIAELSGHLLRVQEEERRRISRELHDETGQGLMVIRLYLGMLEASIRTHTAQLKINETLAVVDRTIEGLRRMLARLSPVVLQELGLIAAIRKEAKDLTKNTGIKARVDVGEEIGRLGADTETAIYRVVQEALHNVAKHSQAKSVWVQMTQEDSAVRLLIEDDGVGFSPKTHSRGKSFGLAGMRERVSTLGGTMRVRSSKGRGTRIEISVPLVQGDVAPGQPLPAVSETYGQRTVAATGSHGPS